MINTENEPVEIAKKMMLHYGLRASAVAHERASEAQLASDAEAFGRWNAVQTAIAEMRTH